MPKVAARVQALGTETALDVMLRAKALEAQGRRVLHLEVGEPDFPTPEHIVEAGVRALRDGRNRRYCPPAGLPELREAIALELSQRGVRAGLDQIVVLPGAKPAVLLGLLAVVEPGDEVVVPDPGFPIYESVVRFCGGVPAAEVTDRTKLIIYNSPNNPTGEVRRDLEQLAATARERDLWVMADEIYRRITYAGDVPCIAALPGMAERTILVDGFSKAYAMTGWRLGYGVFPPRLAPHAVRLVINSNTCTAAFIQLAGLAALTGPQAPVEAMVAEFRKRRDLIVSRLNAIEGVRCNAPDGAFYAFPKVPRAGLAERLLEEEGVAVLDGAGFGNNGKGHLRFSFASSMETLEEAAAALRRVLEVGEIPPEKVPRP